MSLNKKYRKKEVAICIVIFSALLAAIGQLLFKLGSSKINFNLLTWFNWQILFGLLLCGSGVILFTFILKRFELSTLYPFVATSYIWVALFSFFLLKETLSLLNWMGMFVIVAGISLTTMK